MAQFSVKINQIKQLTEEEKELANELRKLGASINDSRNSLSFKIASKYNIVGKLNRASMDISGQSGGMCKMCDSLENVVSIYEDAELRALSKGKLVGNTEGDGKRKQDTVSEFIGVEQIDFENFPMPAQLPQISWADEFWDEYGWKGLLAGSNYIDRIYNIVNDVRKGKTWRDLYDSGRDIYDFVGEAAQTYHNYKKIGNAVGTKKAMTWWAKNITGIKPLGRASAAKNPFARFAHNLTNKTSPFNAQFKNIVGDFKGANGVGKAVSSWGTVAVSGVLNWFSNKEEQIASNGTMSNGRVVAETITETVIDTALTYGAGIIVGAAVTAVCGTVAAPGVLVVAASGAIIAGVNAGVKALTGKTTTEWVSDTILDTGEAIGKAVSNVAKNVTNSVGSWFKKLSFA